MDTTDARIAEAADGYTARQVRKALAAIAARTVIPTDVDGLFSVLSATPGHGPYLTDKFGNCSCPAGRKATRCWHGLACRLLAALPEADQLAYARSVAGQAPADVLTKAAPR